MGTGKGRKKTFNKNNEKKKKKRIMIDCMKPVKFPHF